MKGVKMRFSRKRCGIGLSVCCEEQADKRKGKKSVRNKITEFQSKGNMQRKAAVEGPDVTAKIKSTVTRTCFY